MYKSYPTQKSETPISNDGYWQTASVTLSNTSNKEMSCECNSEERLQVSSAGVGGRGGGGVRGVVGVEGHLDPILT